MLPATVFYNSLHQLTRIFLKIHSVLAFIPIFMVTNSLSTARINARLLSSWSFVFIPVLPDNLKHLSPSLLVHTFCQLIKNKMGWGEEAAARKITQE